MAEEEWHHEGVAKYDDLPHEEKEKVVADLDNWPDTVCGNCHRHCCVNCTAGGNPSSCAQTMFRNCSVCGCPSAGHYPG